MTPVLPSCAAFARAVAAGAPRPELAHLAARMRRETDTDITEAARRACAIAGPTARRAEGR